MPPANAGENMLHKRDAFTLIELLVVISIITILTTAALPSLVSARNLARSAYCLSNLRVQASAVSMYQSDHDGLFPMYRRTNWPIPKYTTYFWGSDDDPVDMSLSWYMQYLQNDLQSLWCPEMPWGSYTPQGRYVAEPTTTYGYNAFYLDKTLDGENLKKIEAIPRPDQLFVFVDAAMCWSPGGVAIFQTSSYLEPVEGNFVQQPTTHFRHRDLTNALCADGHAESFGTEGWKIDNEHNLGFVGTKNDPHYAQ